MPNGLSVEAYAKIVEELTPDGALRDIHVFDTTLADWQRFLDFVESQNLGATFIRGDDVLKPPLMANQLFSRGPDDLEAWMSFRLEGMDYNCHFFAAQEIEIDVDPRQIEDPSALDSLLDFMVSLGRYLKKDVLLTHEGFCLAAALRWEDVICSYASDADQLSIGAAPRPVFMRVRYRDDFVSPDLQLWKRTFWEILVSLVMKWANGLEVVGTGDSREVGSIRLLLLAVDEDVFFVAGSPVVERPNEWATSGSTAIDTKATGPAEAAEQVAFDLKQKIGLAPSADFRAKVLGLKEALIDRVIESRLNADGNPGPFDREAIWRDLEPFIGLMEATQFKTAEELLKRIGDIRPPSEWK
jgi:hypothetical protein